MQTSKQVFGLKTVYEPTPGTAATSGKPPAPFKPTVEIIFVHGLGGSSRGTWTNKESLFWPDWLHEVKGLENARIRTFGYDSDWNLLKRISNLGVQSFGMELSHHLTVPSPDEPPIEVSPVTGSY